MTADFNDGFADLAVGVPAENGVGAVNVLYGTAAGLSGAGGQLFSQVGGAVEGVDGFGSALAAGDFNNDDFADLAIGAPNDDVVSALDAGAVSVLYGSANGLTTQGGQLFTQVGGAIEGDDRFGSALAAGDFNNNGFADLAVGAPGETVGNQGGAGAVSVGDALPLVAPDAVEGPPELGQGSAWLDQVPGQQERRRAQTRAMSWTARASTLQAAASAALTRRPSASPPVGVQVISPATISESPRTVMSTGGEVEVDGGGWFGWAALAGAQSTTQASTTTQVTISARR